MFWFCKHDGAVRCVHGDEINSTIWWYFHVRYARVACVKCGRYVYNRPLPEVCTFTNKPHWKATVD